MFARITSLFYLYFCAIDTKCPLYFLQIQHQRITMLLILYDMPPQFFYKIFQSEFCIILPPLFSFLVYYRVFWMNTPCEKSTHYFCSWFRLFNSSNLYRNNKCILNETPPSFFCNERAQHETTVGQWGIWISMW